MRFKVEFVLDIDKEAIKDALNILGQKAVFNHGKAYVKENLTKAFDQKPIQEVKDIKVFLEI